MTYVEENNGVFDISDTTSIISLTEVEARAFLEHLTTGAQKTNIAEPGASYNLIAEAEGDEHWLYFADDKDKIIGGSSLLFMVDDECNETLDMMAELSEYFEDGK